MSVFKVYVSLEQESINIIFSFKKGKYLRDFKQFYVEFILLKKNSKIYTFENDRITV